MQMIFDYQNAYAKNLDEKTCNDCDIHFIVTLSKCSTAVGAREVLAAVQSAITEEAVPSALVEVTGCGGMCHAEPIVTVRQTGQPDVMYSHMTPGKAHAIVVAHGLYNKMIWPWVLNK